MTRTEIHERLHWVYQDIQYRYALDVHAGKPHADKLRRNRIWELHETAKALLVDAMEDEHGE